MLFHHVKYQKILLSGCGRTMAACLIATIFLLSGCNRSAEDPAHNGLWFGGDVHWGDLKTDQFEALRPLVENRLGIINLEGPVVSPDTFAAPPDSQLRLHNVAAPLSFLHNVNAEIIHIANNHQDDYSAAGEQSTHLHLSAANLQVADARRGLITREIGGLTIGYLGYNLGPEPINMLRQRVEIARTECDVLVCAFHVTAPPTYLPLPPLRDAVDVAVDAGAAIVVTHGTHLLGPVERRGNAIIAWGLGNLLFNCDCTDEREGLLLMVDLNTNDPGNVIGEAIIVPVEAGLMGEPVRLLENPSQVLDLLESLGSSEMVRRNSRGYF